MCCDGVMEQRVCCDGVMEQRVCCDGVMEHRVCCDGVVEQRVCCVSSTGAVYMIKDKYNLCTKHLGDYHNILKYVNVN